MAIHILESTRIGTRVRLNAVVLYVQKCVWLLDREVIGAGAVVTHNVPADEVWAVNPATQIVRSSLGQGVRKRHG